MNIGYGLAWPWKSAELLNLTLFSALEMSHITEVKVEAGGGASLRLLRLRVINSSNKYVWAMLAIVVIMIL